MLFKIANGSISGIIDDEKKEASFLPDEWFFDKKAGMLYCVVRAVSEGVNGNGDGFSIDELKKAYRTFVGKGVFVNHASNDVEKQRGLIIDAKLANDVEGKLFVKCLMEINAVAYPEFAQMVRSGHLFSVSMGASVKYSTCSVCGNRAKTTAEYCTCVRMHKGGVFNGKQVYEQNHEVEFIECSFVNKGADAQATVLEVFARQKGYDLQGLLQKSAKDPTYLDRLQAEADLLKDDDGCVEDDHSEEEGIHPPVHDLNAIKSEAGVIIERINNLLYLASALKQEGKELRATYQEIDKWQERLRELKKQAEEERFIKLLIKANGDLGRGIIDDKAFEELNKLAEQLWEKQLGNITNKENERPLGKYPYHKYESYVPNIGTDSCSKCGTHRDSKYHLLEGNPLHNKRASTLSVLGDILKLAAKKTCTSPGCNNSPMKYDKRCSTCVVGRIGPPTNVRSTAPHKNPKYENDRKQIKQTLKKQDWDG